MRSLEETECEKEDGAEEKPGAAKGEGPVRK